MQSVYGAAGSLVLVVLWVYDSAQTLLLGAELTRVHARHLGIWIEVKDNAAPLTDAQSARQGLAPRAPAGRGPSPPPEPAPRPGGAVGDRRPGASEAEVGARE